MDYTHIDDNRQRQEIVDQITFREVQHLRTALELSAIQAAAGPEPNDVDAQEIKTRQNALFMLDRAHVALTAELEKFDASRPPEPAPASTAAE